MLATELAKDMRFRVIIVTDYFDQPGVETKGNITIHRTADISYTLLRGMGRLWKSLRAANADIYFAQGASLTNGLVALFCRTGHRAFFLRTSSDFECGGAYLRRYPFKGRCFLSSLRVAECVFAQTSDNVRNLKQSTSVDAIAIPTGHRITEFQDTKRDFILWVGRIAEVKQPSVFLRLAREVPSERFVMICQARPGNRRYGELARLATGTANLQLIKSVPFQEVEHYFRRAKVLVNTSSSEGFPNSFIQAGMCGTAILSLKVNPDGFLDRFSCGFCASGDWNKFADSLKELVRDDLHLRIGENARKYVQENHDIGRVIDRYKDCFLSAVSRTSTTHYLERPHDIPSPSQTLAGKK
jgi:glycosyltransferase involved in cell wall biosynthesis